ncbi:unnamed protein product [Moneuplotes crassus]|uniref:Uncharacterized protein n=1 Tax=Euplotes crassus TaxID=5936 RepID=A0AAD1XPM3_EUPCR|nr:unnamed protein product [Moneuplotes crassus]
MIFLTFVHQETSLNDLVGKTESRILDEIMTSYPSYNWKTQAIIATFIIQTVPVIVMALVYTCLKKFVRDSKNSLLIQLMYAFTFGSIMGDVFFHIFPSLNNYHTQDGKVFERHQQIRMHYYFVGGMILSYFLEVIINRLFSNPCNQNSDLNEDESRDKRGDSSPVILAFFGDFFHNFADGLAIASTFGLSPKLGLTTAVASFIHEIPDEIGDFAYLYKNGYGYRQALSYQLLTGFGSIMGAFTSFTFSGNTTIEMVAVSGGLFTYMSLLVFLNDLRDSSRISWAIANTILIFLGLYVMQTVALFQKS